jgi:MFS transporter, SP family, sugar:H+ symporter
MAFSGLFARKRVTDSKPDSDNTTENKDSTEITHAAGVHVENTDPQDSDSNYEEKLEEKPPATLAYILGAVSSIGGLIFGYESGQISGTLSLWSRLWRMCLLPGPVNRDHQNIPRLFTLLIIASLTPLGFLQMSDFLDRFGEDGKFTATRQGTIVGLLSAGTLVGCLLSGWICDKIGRRHTISASSLFYIVGVIIEFSSKRQWVQFAIGRFAAGLGIGALSTSVPIYQSESVPKKIRGKVVSSYQLMITSGMLAAYLVCAQ